MKTAAKDFKMTELGPIPKDWEVKRLGDVAPLQRGFDLPTAELEDGPYPVVYSNGIGNYHRKAMCDAPGLVTGRSGTIGHFTYIAEGRYWPHNTALWVTSFNGNHPLFVKYLYETLGFENFSTGTGVPTLNRNIVHDYLISLPPLPEQRKISAALSDVDEMIAALEKLIEKKRKIKTGTMQRLLTGKTRLPSFKGAWVEKRFEEFIVRFATGLNPRQNFRLNDGGNNFYVTIKDFREGRLYFDECDKVDDIALKMINNRSDLRKGDMLFSSIGRVGDAYVIKETPKNWNVNESVFVLRPDVTMMDVDFMYYLIKSERVQDKLTGGTTGSTLTGIKVGHLKEISCEFPSSLAEQKAIAKVLGDMDEEIAALEAELAKTRQLKQGMMQELLTGKVRLV